MTFIIRADTGADIQLFGDPKTLDPTPERFCSSCKKIKLSRYYDTKRTICSACSERRLDVAEVPPKNYYQRQVVERDERYKQLFAVAQGFLQPFSTNTLADTANVSIRAAANILNTMRERGWVELVGEQRVSRYGHRVSVAVWRVKT